MPIRKLTKKENHQNKPWITLVIRKSIKRRDALHKRFIKAKNPDMKKEYNDRYKALRNKLVTLCRNSKNNYYQKFFESNANNLRNTWKGIRKIINLKEL